MAACWAGVSSLTAGRPSLEPVAQRDITIRAVLDIGMVFVDRNGTAIAKFCCTVTATMLQQNPDICSVIDFWDGDASGAAAAIRDAGLQDKVALVTTGGGEQAADCDMIANGTYSAVVMTELVREGGDLVAMIKYLLQSGIAPGTTSAYIYTLEQATTKANMRPDSCWSLKALQAMNP